MKGERWLMPLTEINNDFSNNDAPDSSRPFWRHNRILTKKDNQEFY